jgi:hypothetical protein
MAEHSKQRCDLGLGPATEMGASDLRITIEPTPKPTEVDAIAAVLAILRRPNEIGADVGARPKRTRWAEAGRREALRSPKRLAAGWHRRDGGPM